MSERIVVFGHGPVGAATTRLLLQTGAEVLVAQRSRPADLPAGARFQACDVLDGEAVRATAAGAQQIVAAVGFPYEGKVWETAWPRAMTHLVGACETTGARMVFVDNLYMYGEQTVPLTEDMPARSFGQKPRARTEATKIWRAASEAGRIRATALRPSDFFGPGVGATQLGDAALGALARGKPAALVLPPDLLHDFAYVPDIARAVVTLTQAPDADFGQVWHCPNAPIRTPRQLLQLAADALGVKLAIQSLPLWALPAIGLFSPFLRELVEMRYQWRHPYRVDASKFGRRFWSDATPFEISIPETARSFRPG
jgi:nucleoside-diphosphate-sugar epimerase